MTYAVGVLSFRLWYVTAYIFSMWLSWWGMHGRKQQFYYRRLSHVELQHILFQPITTSQHKEKREHLKIQCV